VFERPVPARLPHCSPSRRRSVDGTGSSCSSLTVGCYSTGFPEFPWLNRGAGGTVCKVARVGFRRNRRQPSDQAPLPSCAPARHRRLTVPGRARGRAATAPIPFTLEMRPVLLSRLAHGGFLMAAPRRKRLLNGVVEYATGITLPDGIGADQWAGLVQRVARDHSSSRWKLGDLARYGEPRYGRMYEQAMAATGLSYQIKRSPTANRLRARSKFTAGGKVSASATTPRWPRSCRPLRTACSTWRNGKAGPGPDSERKRPEFARRPPPQQPERSPSRLKHGISWFGCRIARSGPRCRPYMGRRFPSQRSAATARPRRCGRRLLSCGRGRDATARCSMRPMRVSCASSARGSNGSLPAYQSAPRERLSHPGG
jgi:hypothetical protein